MNSKVGLFNHDGTSLILDKPIMVDLLMEKPVTVKHDRKSYLTLIG